MLSLYNALNGKNYSNCDQLEIVTLENAIYMSMKNDLAFILDLDLFLWEHQSTYNPNIPLRDLMYIAKEYEKYIKEKGISLYSSRQHANYVQTECQFRYCGTAIPFLTVRSTAR